MLDDGFAASTFDGGKSWVPKIRFPFDPDPDDELFAASDDLAEAWAEAARRSLTGGEPMSEAEYLDPQRFPLTTQGGLSYEEQRHLDSFNLDQLRGAVEDGHQLDDEQRAILGELEEKLAAPIHKAANGSEA